MTARSRELSRRELLWLGLLVALLRAGQGGASAQTDASDERPGSTYQGAARETQATAQELVDAITTQEFASAVDGVSLQGVSAQAGVFTTLLQGFPTEGTAYTVLSSGDVTEVPASPLEFISTDMEGGTILEYSPDGYDAHDVVTLNVDFTVPPGAEAVAFDYKFGTEENPTYLGSSFQDFFEAIFVSPGGAFENIALLPDGSPVTVSNSNAYANSPGGDSNNPTAPLPDPPDVAFNSVTGFLTAQRGVSGLVGQEVRLRFRVADASDHVLDSGVFIDNLRFTGELEDNLQPLRTAIDQYIDAYENGIRSTVRAIAEAEAALFVEHGDAFSEEVVNYFGYLAGEVDESAVTDGLTETFDPVMGSPEDVEAFYEFQLEMYEAASGETSVTEVADVFFEYYMGTYDGQQHFYQPRPPESSPLTDVDTLDGYLDAVSSCFDVSKTELIAAIEALTLTVTEISKFVDYFQAATATEIQAKNRRVRMLNRTAADLSESEADEFQGTLDVPQSEDVTTQHDRDAQLAPPLIYLGFAMTYTVGLYVTSKAATYAAANAGAISWTAANTASSISTVTTTKLGSWASTSSPFSNLPKISVAHSVFTKAYLRKQIRQAWNLYQDIVDCFSIPFEYLAILQAQTETLSTNFSRILDAEITELTVENLTYDDQIENTEMAKGTGSMTIQNTGAVAFTPNLRSSSLKQVIKFAGIVTQSGYPVNFTDPVPQLEPGETADLDFEVVAPLGLHNFATDYRLTIDIAQTGERATTTFTTQAADIDFGVATTNVIDSVVEVGGSVVEEFTTQGTTEQVTYAMNHTAFNADLHLFDEFGNHTGYNYETNQMEYQIPNAIHSGRDPGAEKHEWASVTDAGEQEFTVGVVVPEIGTVQGNALVNASTGSPVTSQQTGTSETEVSVVATEVPNLPATLEVQPVVASTTVGRGETSTVEIELYEVTDSDDVTGLTFTASDLVRDGGEDTIPAASVSFESAADTVGAGDVETAQLTVAAPEDSWLGEYTGQVTATGNDGSTSDTIEIRVTVEQVLDLPPVGSATSTPLDIDGDGRYEDVNGDGVFDIVDVQALFANLDDPVVLDNPDAFDFNGDGIVDVVDVQALFTMLS